MNTHYAIVSLGHDNQIQRGMYTCSDAYATPALARELGPAYFADRGGYKALALAEVETEPSEQGGRRMIRQVVLAVLTE